MLSVYEWGNFGIGEDKNVNITRYGENELQFLLLSQTDFPIDNLWIHQLSE